MSKKEKGKEKAPAEISSLKASSQSSGNSLAVNVSDRASSDSSTADRSAAFPGEPRARLRTGDLRLAGNTDSTTSNVASAHVTTAPAPTYPPLSNVPTVPYPTPVSMHTSSAMPTSHHSSAAPIPSSAPVPLSAQAASANVTATSAAGYSFVPGAVFSGHGLSSSSSGRTLAPGHPTATAPIPIPGVAHRHSSSIGSSSSGGHPNTHSYARSSASRQSQRMGGSIRTTGSGVFQIDIGSLEGQGPQQTQQAPTPYHHLQFPPYYSGAHASLSVAGPSGHGTAQPRASTSNHPWHQPAAHGMRSCFYCGKPLIGTDGEYHESHCEQLKKLRRFGK